MRLKADFVVMFLRIAFVIQTLLLSKSVCAGCDDDCDIRSAPDLNSVPSFLGEVSATQQNIWIKPKDAFIELVIQLKIDTQFDFRSDKISSQNLTISKADLFQAIPPANQNQWNKIDVTVEQKDVPFAPDPYNIVAKVGQLTFVKETGLWWRVNTIKSMQFLAKGGCEVSVGCHPCEPATQSPPLVDVPGNDSFVTGKTEFVIEPTEICGSPSPAIYMLTGIIVILILAIVCLLITFKCMYTRQTACYKKKSIGLPYLEGNYFKEENIYDELSCKPKSRQFKEENIYDEISSRPVSNPGPSRGFDTSVNANQSVAPVSSSKPKEPTYQTVPFPSLQTADKKVPDSDCVSISSTASSDTRQGNPVNDTDSECISERDERLEGMQEPPSLDNASGAFGKTS